MRISNFKLVKKTGNCVLDYKFWATIDVEKGFLFWKKKQTVEISKTYMGCWYYVDDGSYVEYKVDALCRAYCAKKGCALEEIEFKKGE